MDDKDTNKESESKLYEISYLVKADDEQSALEGANTISGAIEKGHGIVINQTQPSKKTLEYPVNKEQEGWWGYIKFTAKPENISHIRTEAGKDGKILRFALFKASKTETMEKPRRKRKVATSAEEKTSIAEIDKKLEEMLGS